VPDVRPTRAGPPGWLRLLGGDQTTRTKDALRRLPIALNKLVWGIVMTTPKIVRMHHVTFPA